METKSPPALHVKPTPETMASLAKLLQINPAALAEFEKEYKASVLDSDYRTNDLLGTNSRMMSEEVRSGEISENEAAAAAALAWKIVNELCAQTAPARYDGKKLRFDPPLSPTPFDRVTRKDILALPERVRPQLSGSLIKADIEGPSFLAVLQMYQLWKDTGDATAYHMFRQGLDTLDLDSVLYKMLGKNPNTIGSWLPDLALAVEKTGFFKIPKTTVVKVPLPILQLTRCDYRELTPTTLHIVDEWAMKVFDLDVSKSYFIKTGVFSSKFDFRNAKVSGEKEVRELGEYLLFIHHQTVEMACSFSNPCIYGAATTNEWVVREYVEDKENNPAIYKGLPLHTEYRVFVDFDTKSVIGAVPYWYPEQMLSRFSSGMGTSMHDRHDYVVYRAHMDTMMERFNQNRSKVEYQITNLIKNMSLSGQWSIDVMQNGDEFWLIDMATADTSALKEYLPCVIKPREVNWLPEFT